MKGKGKGERSGKDKEDLKDCPLQFPDTTPVDHTRQCLRYTSILQRDESEGLGIEEVDTLQTEMEIMLASVAKRMRQLENELQVLNNWQEGKVMPTTPSTPKGKGGGKGSNDSTKKSESNKRSIAKGSEEKSSKKFKESAGKGSNTKGGSKGKVQQIKVQEYEFPESPSASAATGTKPGGMVVPPAPEPPKLKTDVPNRFWALVEPYCADVTNEDLKVLEDIMKSHDEDSEYYKIPPLGKHYTDKWAHDDLLEEQRESGKLGDSRRNSAEVNALLKKDDEPSPFGPLTQRLVQALIEENIMTPLDDQQISEADAAEAASISPRSLAKQLNIGNTAALERRIKKELEENGILEAEDDIDDSPDDEIVMELRKKQQELKSISQHNLLVSKKLYKLAKDEMAQQELRKKVTMADNEVMEAYRKIQAIRAKKKSPTKKELDTAKKVLKEREALVKQLESHS